MSKDYVNLPSDTTTGWMKNNPVLPLNVVSIDTTAKDFKVHDGKTAWADLPYFLAAPLANYAKKQAGTGAMGNYPFSYTPANFTAKRDFNAATATVADLYNVVATLMADLNAFQAALSAGAVTNWAVQANGGTATASTTLDSGDGRNWSAANSNDGNRLFPGGNWTDGGIFHAPGVPVTVEYQFAGMKSITQINVFGVRDSFSDKSALTQTETFSTYGNTAFSIDYWNGTAWVNIAAVTGNNKVWRQFNFAAVLTSKVRIVITAAGDGYGRLMEFEVLG